jgi:RNA polymerase sigma factor (sigma-70 family)
MREEKTGRPAMTTVELAMKSRDRDDMGALFERYAPFAHRVAFLLLGDQDEASDIVQDAFVRLFGRFRNVRRPESFEWYLRRTVINLCRDRQRRKRAERSRDARLTSMRQDPSLPAPESSDLIGVLRRLPYRQQTAIVLRYLEDLSIEETADLMGCSPSAIKSLVNRGMESLRMMTRGESWT